MILKKHFYEIDVAFDRVVKSKPKFYIWQLNELTREINKLLSHKLNNRQIGQFLSKFQQRYHLFKRVQNSEYIFIKGKRK